MKETVATAGTVPEIFNTDQGCQFTSKDCLRAVEGPGFRYHLAVVPLEGVKTVNGQPLGRP